MTDVLAERDALILAHLTLVETVAKQIARKFPSWFDTESFTSAGMIGLIEAAASYKPGTNVPFPPFARIRIHGAIIDHVRSLDAGTRDLRKWQREKRRCENFFLLCWQKPALAEQIAQMMDISWEQYCIAFQRIVGTKPVSFEYLVVDSDDLVDDSDNFRATNDLRCEEHLTPHEAMSDLQEQRLLARATSYLNEQQRMVIALYYRHELSETAIGKIMDLSQVRVNAIRRKAENLIRKRYTTNHVPLTIADYDLSVFDVQPRPEYQLAMGYESRQHDGR